MGYYDVASQRITLNGESIILCTKPGGIAWDETATAVMLLAACADVQPGARWLVLEDQGALATWADRRGLDTHCYHHHLISSRLTHHVVMANQADHVVIHDSAMPEPDEMNRFDTALLVMPKGRAFTRLLLAAAWAALKPGGRLYLAGANAAGAKASLTDAAEIFGRAVTLRTKARSRVGLAVKSGDTPPVMPPLHRFEINGLRVFSSAGVFSTGELDAGTATLLDTLDTSTCGDRRVLDVGCGCGVIGLTAAKLGANTVDMVDVNRLAVACAQKGIHVNGLSQCQAATSDLYSDLDDRPYDLILTNPPFHAGHAVDLQITTEIITGAWTRLSAEGRLRLVANGFLPYDRLMAAVFGDENVRVVAQDTRFRVLEGQKTKPGPSKR